MRACISLLMPVATALPMTRFGRDSDGGYVLPGLHGMPPQAISLGIGSEMSFDRALLAGGYVVHQFERRIEGPAGRQTDQHFNKIHVVGVDPGPAGMTLDDIVTGKRRSGPGAVIFPTPLDHLNCRDRPD